MPRVGKLTTRANAVSSFGLSMQTQIRERVLHFPARSKKRKPPYTRYAMPAFTSVCSIVRDCALLR